MHDAILANIIGPDAGIVLVLAFVLLFGAGQLPKAARSIGEARRELKKAQEEAASAAAGEQPPGK